MIERNIIGANAFDTYTKVRAASRALIIRDGQILLSYAADEDTWMIPGGGREEGETPEACCIRETEEETGMKIRELRPFLRIDEYYEDCLYTTHYFLCEAAEGGRVHLTEEEQKAGMRPEWLPLQQALKIFSRHEDFAETDEMKRGLYLREYRALSEYLAASEAKNPWINIRLMTAEDYDKVYALWMSCKNMGFNDVDDSKEGITRYLRRNPTTSFVAEDGDRIAGVILAGHDGRRGFIHHMAVGEAYRRRGIATDLLDHALAALKEEGIHKVALLVFKRNIDGNAFWEKSGFTVREDVAYRNKELTKLVRIDT